MPKHRDSAPQPLDEAEAIPMRPTCAVVETWLEALLDEELDVRSRRRLEDHLASCDGCAAQLALAERIRFGLRSLPLPPCPDRVTDAVLKEVGAVSGRRWWQRLGENFGAAVWVPALASLLIVLIASFYLASRSVPPPEEIQPSVEVAQAEAEVKLALAYLGQISRATGQAVGQEILGEKVALPMARSLREIVSPKPLPRAGGAEDAS